MTSDAHGQICVVSCYALGVERVAQFLNRLGDELAARDIQLLVLGTRRSEVLRYPLIDIPYSVLGFDREIQLEGLVPFHAVAPVMAAERAWSGLHGNADAYARGTAKCEWFYQAVAEELAPAAALLWNTTHPHSRVARGALQCNDIPTWCLERGQLAHTFQIQAGEVNAWNDLRVGFAQHAGLRLDLARQQGDAFDAALALSRSEEVDRHPPTGAAGAARAKGGAPRLLVLASAAASSVEPATPRSVRISQPGWEGTQAILEALARVLPPAADIVFRDHPINTRAGLIPRLPGHFHEDASTPIGELIESADRVACIGTTTLQYEALLRDKPLLMLGRSPATDADAAYMADHDAGLDDVVAAWLSDQDGPRKRANARALVGLLCERHLIREDERALHVRNGVAELADFIAAQAVPQAEPVADRIDRFAQRILAACAIGEPA